jgi:uncharacterized membrane protein YdbT with pleckstrin-like domain
MGRSPAQPIRSITSSVTRETKQKGMHMPEVLYQASPSMFKNNPIGFILTLVLCIVGIGLLILLIWWLRCKGQVLTITSEKVSKRTGILSKHTNDVYHEDIKNIQVRQSLFQRMFGVGALAIASAGTGGVEIAIAGIPDPNRIKEIIEEQRRRAKA